MPSYDEATIEVFKKHEKKGTVAISRYF